ncbi:MAG: NTP transferase domain-containing protein [Anaerolineales bacterium]|nr:NTP transferase domain-containing protein [Anaerolineales bacterium]
MQAVILAAGRGKRLGSLTHKRSKAMQPILSKPMVERVMESLHAHGVDHFTIVTNPDNPTLREHLENQLSFDVELDFAYQEEPLGMANALQMAAPFIRENFVLSACDNLITIADLDAFFQVWNQRQGLNGLLTLMRVPRELINRSGIVEMNGHSIKRIVEKPEQDNAPSNIASLPIYGFSPRILDYLDRVPLSARGEYELQDAIQMMIEQDGGVDGVEVSKRMTVTRPEDLLAVNLHYLSQDPALQVVLPDTIGEGVTFTPPVYVETGVELGAGCQIGPYAYLENGVQVGARAQVTNAVVLSGAVIPPDSIIEDTVVKHDH